MLETSFLTGFFNIFYYISILPSHTHRAAHGGSQQAINKDSRIAVRIIATVSARSFGYSGYARCCYYLGSRWQRKCITPLLYA